MSNLINPFDWISSTQDWFSKTERSSGFRPFLIYLILIFIISICLLSFFGNVQYANEVALGIIIIPTLSFIFIYSIKSFTEPNFCRSEKHIENVKKIELEFMGNETEQVSNIILEYTPKTIEEKSIQHNKDKS